MSYKNLEGNRYKYDLIGVDVASRYRLAKALMTKTEKDVICVLEVIDLQGKRWVLLSK